MVAAKLGLTKKKKKDVYSLTHTSIIIIIIIIPGNYLCVYTDNWLHPPTPPAVGHSSLSCSPVQLTKFLRQS